jgi:anaerobic selenocysteine-containing dehydrogenase
VPDSSRRKFLAAAGAGTAVVGAAALLPAGAAAAAAPKGAAHPGPLVAHVRNTSTGEIAVYVGEKEVVVRDKDLAHRIARIANTER